MYIVYFLTYSLVEGTFGSYYEVSDSVKADTFTNLTDAWEFIDEYGINEGYEGVIEYQDGDGHCHHIACF